MNKQQQNQGPELRFAWINSIVGSALVAFGAIGFASLGSFDAASFGEWVGTAALAAVFVAMLAAVVEVNAYALGRPACRLGRGPRLAGVTLWTLLSSAAAGRLAYVAITRMGEISPWRVVVGASLPVLGILLVGVVVIVRHRLMAKSPGKSGGSAWSGGASSR